MAFRPAREQHPACLSICGFVAPLQSWRALFTYFTCFLVQNTKPNYTAEAIQLHSCTRFHPLLSNTCFNLPKIIDWVFRAALHQLALLRAGLFATAQENHPKAGEAACQGGREKTAGVG